MRIPPLLILAVLASPVMESCSQARPDSGTNPIPDAAPSSSQAPGQGAAKAGDHTSQGTTVALGVGRDHRAAEAPRPDLVNGIPVVEVDFKAQADSIVEAVRTGGHPERLTVMITPKKFELASYRRDPGKYLNVIEPGRVNQPAEPSADVPDLLPVGPDGFTVPELGSVTIAFRTAPRAPLSLTSLDMGAFANGQSAITVQADDEGIARAVFTATRGTVADCRILVASPMAAYQRSVMVSIVPSLPIVNPR